LLIAVDFKLNAAIVITPRGMGNTNPNVILEESFSTVATNACLKQQEDSSGMTING
jgi:hypothetical protein